MAKQIDGQAFKCMMLEAAGMVESKKEEINELNVFPVPDGDTGTNMSLTLNNAANELQKIAEPTLGRALEITASGLLRGARGNSGVITSLLFRGFAKSMKECSTAAGADIANALADGAATAYKAVLKPAEGTILTVARVSAEAAVKAAKKGADAEKVLAIAAEAARVALAKTVEQNPVLKKAGVVDAGGYGWVLVLEAMHNSFIGVPGQISKFLFDKPKTPVSVAGADFSKFDTEEITFAYCTEFIAERTDKRRSVDKFRDFLQSIGDCVVVVDDEEIIKIHVHTDNPDKAMGEGMKFGRLSAIKIENMLEQHENKIEDGKQQGTNAKREVAEPEHRYGFVSVVAGDGVCNVFRDLGADSIVEGGQTMNPSTEDILAAIDATPAEVVFVLPNNKNIIMASEQAADLATKQVVVIPTKTVPQGICAMLSFDSDSDIEANSDTMTAAIGGIKTGTVTYAARDSEFDGKKIKQGDFMALSDGKLFAVADRQLDVVKKLAHELCDKKSSFITILYGEGADEAQSEKVRQIFEAAAKNAEVNVIYGGQPVYSYIISVE